MGAWNTKPFGNDTACDWLWELEKATNESALDTALETILSARDSSGADDCDRAIASAAVILASRREPIGKLPEEAKQWVAEHGFASSDSLVKRAIRAVEEIGRQSELRELWAESPSFAKWQKEIASLISELRDAQKCPPPTRKPKPPTARLSLPKFIDRINPDEASPLREKLRRKLDAIADVNAPVGGTFFEPPLNLLAARGLIPEAKRLIERGAEVNPKLIGPLSHTPLEEACGHGRAAMAEFLLRHGAEIYFAREMDVLLPDGRFGKSGKKVFRIPRALYRAVQSGDIATVEALVSHGADLNDEDARKEKLLCLAMHHESLLHKAAAASSPQMIEYLAKRGLELDAQDSLGDTPLKYAVLKRRLDLVLKLLELGAAVNAKDADGNTALDFVDDRNSELWKMLQQHGGKLGEAS